MNKKTRSGPWILTMLVLPLLGFAISLNAMAGNGDPCSVDLKPKLSSTARAWYKDKNLIKPIDGYWIPGAITIAQDPTYVDSYSPADASWMTADFFRRAGITPPADARPAPGLTYRYYRPNDPTADPKRVDRGGGRDHLLIAQTSDPSPKISFRRRKIDYGAQSDKGTGTNDEFSGVNGDFVLTDFRKNGLQLLPEVLIEYIEVVKLEALDVPVVAVPKITLLPEEIQLALGLNLADGANGLAAQTRRIQDLPRDSYAPPTPEQAERKYKLIAATYFHNIGDGAINNENIAQERIADPGHVTVGYPIMAGEYRCLVCQRQFGSSGDSWGVIPMIEYFFPRPASTRRDYSHPTRSGFFEISTEAANGIMSEYTRYLTGNKIEVALTAEEKKAVETVWNKSLWFGTSTSRWWCDEVALESLIKNFAERLLGRKPTTTLANNDAALGTRFLTQLALLPRAVGPQHAEEALALQERVRSLLGEEPAREQFDAFLALINRLTDAATISPRKLRDLFTESLTIDVITNEVEARLRAVRDYAQIKPVADALIHEMTQPVRVRPLNYLNELNQSIDDYLVAKEKRRAGMRSITAADFQAHEGFDVLATLEMQNVQDLHNATLFPSLAGGAWPSHRLGEVHSGGDFWISQPGLGEALQAGQTLQFLVASGGDGGKIRVYSENAFGPFLGEIIVPGTGGWDLPVLRDLILPRERGNSDRIYVEFEKNGTLWPRHMLDLWSMRVMRAQRP